MRISREISDPELAEFFQDISEEALLKLMQDYLADEEIAAAIDHSHKHDRPEDRMDMDAFMLSASHG